MDINKIKIYRGLSGFTNNEEHLKISGDFFYRYIVVGDDDKIITIQPRSNLYDCFCKTNPQVNIENYKVSCYIYNDSWIEDCMLVGINHKIGLEDIVNKAIPIVNDYCIYLDRLSKCSEGLHPTLDLYLSKTVLPFWKRFWMPDGLFDLHIGGIHKKPLDYPI